jgi:hypothetical protein
MDGDLSFDGRSSVVLKAHGATLTPVSGVYTLSSAIWANNMNVLEGATIKANGFPIFVRGMLLNCGKIHNNGNKGANGKDGAAGGLGGASGFYHGGRNGADGKPGRGGDGTCVSYSVACKENGAAIKSGKGGDGVSPGGIEGEATAVPEICGGSGLHYTPISVMSAADIGGDMLYGGSGGASGGGDGTKKGGAGGGGGGVLAIACKAYSIRSTGTLEAKGGDGGEADDIGLATGGGAGATGGEVLVYSTSPNPGCCCAAGWKGAAGANGGLDGTDGEAGAVRWVHIA